MNAELALYLVEQSIPLEKAKSMAAEATGSPADLALAILEALPGALSVAEALDMARAAPPVLVQSTAALKPPRTGPRDFEPGLHAVGGNSEFVHGTYAPVVGSDGLTDAQRNAVGTVGLCPNCQQPNNAHLPACARVGANGFEAVDPKARTKDPLPPVG